MILCVPRCSSLEVVLIQGKNELSFHEDTIMKWKTVSENLLQFDNQLSDFTDRYTESIGFVIPH